MKEFEELKEQARELIDFGNSREKLEGFGMMRVIEYVELNMNKIIEQHDYSLGRVSNYWDVNDMYSLGYDCTKEEAMEVLEEAIDNHDANYGINWNVLDDIAKKNGLKLYEQ